MKMFWAVALVALAVLAAAAVWMGAPVYLIIVALTPNWANDKKQRIVHQVGAAACAILALLWLVIIRGDLGLTFVVSVACMVAGTASRTIERCTVFWLEASMFLSVYASLMIGG